MLVAGSGCDRRTARWIPPEQEPPAPARPVRIPGLEEARPQPPAAPGTRMGPSAAPRAGASTTAGSGASGNVSGVIRLAEGVSAPGGVLFIIARSSSGGPPLAVLKIDDPSFPLDFELGQANVMMQGRRFEGEMTLQARLDLDGNAMTRDPREPSGVVPGVVKAGTTGIEIVLQQGAS